MKKLQLYNNNISNMDIQTTIFGTCEKEFQKVMETFDISQDVLDENLEKLKNWIKSQPHLCHLDIETAILKRYLFGKLFCIERAKSRFEKLHIYKVMLPDFFSNNNLNNTELRQMFDVVNFCIIPQKLPDNSRVILINLNNPDPHVFDVFHLIKIFFMVCDLRLKYDTHSQTYGIIDCKNGTIVHFLKCLAYVNMSNVSENCYEDRMKAIHLVNFPEFACQVMTKIKGFLNKRIADKIYLHKDTKTLKDSIPVEYLPSDYSGNQKSTRELTLQLRDAMGEQKIWEWFCEKENQKSNEMLRIINKSNDIDEFSGAYGTFRKIEVD